MNNIKLVLCFVVIGLVMNGCGGVKVTQTVQESGTAVLIADNPQVKGYGLYSYLLLASEPTSEEQHKRYLEAIRVFAAWTKMEELEKTYKKNELNLTVIPVKTTILTNHPEEMLETYNYVRAREIFNCLPEKSKRSGGPYLVSTLRPLKKGAPYNNHYLMQDLSRVPSNVIALWMDDFTRQIMSPRFWEKNVLIETAKTLRTAVAIAAQGMPDIVASLQTLISVAEKPEE